MAVTLGASGSSGIVWIRPEFRREVTWGGDPAKAVLVERSVDGQLRLSPRTSFAIWQTTVEGHCRPWSDLDQHAARALLPLSQLLLVRESLALVSRSEGRFRDLVALQSDAYWQTDGQGRLVAMSKTLTAWHGGTEGLTLIELLASCDAASLAALVLALSAQKPFRGTRMSGRSPVDQKSFELVLSGEPLRDGAGKVDGWHGTASDVTHEVALLDAVRLRDLAERSSRAKSKFLSHVSHELRTPLNAVLGFSELMMLEKGASNSQIVQLQHINTAGNWLLTMISDLLDQAQFEAGPVTLELTPVDAKAVLEDAIHLVGQQAFASKVTMTLSAGAAPAWVHANATRLKQVFVNLINNAVKYNRAGGDVRLVIRPDADAGRTRIEVHDTGLGLTPEQLTHLFQPFDRIGQAGKGIQGTGIGLVITKDLMTAMGGTIDFVSEVGKGTCVSVVLVNDKKPATL
jgi:signal transduction histidine kinase